MKHSLLDDLLGLKSKLENIEKEVSLQTSEQKQEATIEVNTVDVEQRCEDYLATKDQIILLNIGGKIFQTKEATLLSFKDSLFYSLIMKHKNENSEIPKELFFDRGATYFPLLLNYLRNQKISLKKFNKLEKEEIIKELDYYGMGEILKVNKKQSIDLEWDSTLSKVGMSTVNIQEPSKIRIHSTTCYTHFVTNKAFSDENLIVELESTVTQTDNYFYIGVVNELYNYTANCMCCNPVNSFYIQCDGSSHNNGVRVENPHMMWGPNPVTVGIKINIPEKQIYFYITDKGELGPFTLIGKSFRVVAGHCNTGNGDITISQCYEV